MRRVFASITALLVLGGCATTYLEKPTPTARIPEAPAIAPPRIQELPRSQSGELHPGDTGGVYGNQIALDSGIVRESGPSGGAAFPATDRFEASYKAAGRPRIAILFNRRLSDEVREWRSEARIVKTGDGGVTTTRETAFGRESETVKGPSSVSVQTGMEMNGQHSYPGESYAWGFEDGFIQPFLRAGTVLIDRATIMRLASRSISQGNAPIEVKKVEMDALVNNADIFIEILISRYPSAMYGYEFKASAKEVRTGRILASSTSLNWDRSKSRPKKVVVTDKGYELVNDNAFPSVQKLSADLALDLMNSLAAQWAHR